MGTEVGAGVDGEVLRALNGNTLEARWGQMMLSCRNILVVTWSASR